MKRSYLIAGGIAAVAIVWVLSGVLTAPPPAAEPKKPSAGERAPLVRVARLSAQEKITEVVLFGRTEADRKVTVRAETAGRIARLLKQKGDKVEKGDVIARLAMDDRAARRREAEASVAHYKLAYDAARKLSRKEYRSRVQLAEAKSNLERARAELARIELDIRRTRIRAPFAGVLDDLPVEEGDYLEVNATLGIVADLDPIVVVGEVTEQNRAKITTDAKGWVRLVGGARRAGSVRYLSKVGVTATRTFRIEMAVPNPNGDIAEGLTTEMHIPAEKTMAHFMSPAVLTLSERGDLGVKGIDENNKVIFYPVRLVEDTADGVWVAGLPETVTVITVGHEFVRAGQKVEPSFEAKPTKPQDVAPQSPVAGKAS